MTKLRKKISNSKKNLKDFFARVQVALVYLRTGEFTPTHTQKEPQRPLQWWKNPNANTQNTYKDAN